MKLFRKMRQTLIDEGKLKKYLFYATGEILLIMLGILLAFQINNWNTLRNKKKAEIQYYQNIKRQLNEDIPSIRGNIEYNQLYLNQYEYATQIIEANDRSKIDTLVVISINLTKFSDFHRKSNIFETMVNSGEIMLLKNKRIIERLQRLEETYIYINRLESSHFELTKLYIGPVLSKNIKLLSAEVKNPDQLFEFEFQNRFVVSMAVMIEKHEIYTRALNEINEIIALINEEINSEKDQK